MSATSTSKFLQVKSKKVLLAMENLEVVERLKQVEEKIKRG